MDHPSTLLNGDSSGTMTINCEDYGWDRLDGDLLPKKCLNVIPGSLSKTCSCQTGCKTSRCGCRGTPTLALAIVHVQAVKMTKHRYTSIS